jgi:hypothetical protein
MAEISIILGDAENISNAELMAKIDAAQEAADLVDIAAAYPMGGDALAAFKARAETLQLDEGDWTEVFYCSFPGSELERFAKEKGGVED